MQCSSVKNEARMLNRVLGCNATVSFSSSNATTLGDRQESKVVGGGFGSRACQGSLEQEE